MTGAIWLTEEHVINDFKLVWCKEIELAIIVPHKDNVRNGYLLWGSQHTVTHRSLPQPPNSSSMEARIMDQVIRASTCNFGIIGATHKGTFYP